MSIPNDELEKLVKNLNEKNKVVAKSFLTWLLEKQLDNEDDVLSFDDIKEIEIARRELENGETTSLEDLKREFEI